MRQIAFSNIAWDPAQNETVAKLLRENGVRAIEVAPAKIESDPASISKARATEYRNYWDNHGIEICALQALFFGAEHCAVFEGSALQDKMYEYLTGIFATAEILNARKLVFGSPKNRLKGTLSNAEALDIAVPFFQRVGESALSHGVQLCIEPNPVEYGCDFVTTSAEGLQLVKKVNHPGFGLHLDAAGMTLANEDIREALKKIGSRIDHFHISEKNLAPVGSGTVNHELVGNALREVGYLSWISIEMKQADNQIDAMTKALGVAREFYT